MLSDAISLRVALLRSGDQAVNDLGKSIDDALLNSSASHGILQGSRLTAPHESPSECQAAKEIIDCVRPERRATYGIC
jgi:hypothetical protein